MELSQPPAEQARPAGQKASAPLPAAEPPFVTFGRWRARIATGLQSLALLAGIVIFLAVVNQHYPIHRWLFWHYLGVSLLAGLWAAACASAGCLIAWRSGVAACTGPADLVLAFPLGVLAFELAIFLIGLAGLLGTITFCVLPALFLFSGLGRLRAVFLGWRRLPPARNAAELAVVVLGVVSIGLLYFQILSPAPFSWDARWYHLPIAEQYALQGSIRAFPEGWWLSAYPHAASYIYTWAFLLPFDSLFDKLELCAHIELAVFLATIASIPALVRMLVPGASARMAWAAIFLFPGIFLYDGNLHAGADHMAALWCIPLVLVLVRFWASWSVRDGILLGTFAAAVLLSKYSAWAILFFVAPTVLVRAVWLGVRRLRGRSGPKVLPAFLACGVAAVLLATPHWLTNWIWYGDPMFPIWNQWFAAHPWSAESPASYRLFVSFTFPPAPGWQGVKDALLATITFSFIPNDWWPFHHNVPVFGSLFTLTTLCLPFVRASARLWLAYLGIMVSMVAWYLMNHQDRYLQAWLPIMAGATLATLMLLWRQRRPVVRALVVVLVAVQMIWGGDVPFLPTHNLVYDSPLRLHSNFLASGFLHTPHRLRPYDMGEVGESLPRDAVVLIHEIQLQMGLGVRVVRDQWQGRISYPALKSPPAIYDRLKSLEVTYLLWNTDSTSGWNSIASDLAFANFAVNFGADPVSIDKYTVARMPGSPPSAGINDKVAMLTCHGPYGPGWYQLDDLVVPDPGKPWASPRSSITNLDDAVEEAGFLVVDPGCHPTLPDAVGRLFRRPFSRSSQNLYVRKAP